MPSPREGRRGRRLVGGLAVATAVSLVGLATPTYADDDYPYRGLGQCPLVPLPPTPPPSAHPAGPHPSGFHPPGTHPPGSQQGGKPGPAAPAGPPAPTAPPPPRVCAKHIWYLNGSYGDPWSFALRNCTSFVAWRLRETNGVGDFTRDFGGVRWGDAHSWDDAATSLGYLVDDVPAVGAVAQTDHGSLGHVAWVSGVGEGTVTVEEYNYLVAGGYDVRTAPTSEFRYLHVDDVAPAPYLGSIRAAATATDPRGGVWAARTSVAGDLTVRGPAGRLTHLGARGAFSSSAAPSIVTDGQGRMWLAAVTRDGLLVTTHTDAWSTHWRALRPLLQGGWSATSSPTLVLDGQDQLRLYDVSETGDLGTRLLRSDGRWVHPGTLGRPGSWSTHASVAATADDRGRLWLAALTRGGTLQAQHTRVDGSRGAGFRVVDGRSWSTTSTPSLVLAGDRVRLTSVTSRGILVTRHSDASARWQHGVELPGTWSPYASPAATSDSSGRLWLAATTASGAVVVRAAVPDSERWRVVRTTTGGPVTTGPGLVPAPTGGVQLMVPAVNGLVGWQLLGAPRHTRSARSTTYELVQTIRQR